MIMKLLVIDGQGGKMGRAIVEQLKKELPEQEISAIGTSPKNKSPFENMFFFS